MPHGKYETKILLTAFKGPCKFVMIPDGSRGFLQWFGQILDNKDFCLLMTVLKRDAFSFIYLP